MFILFPISPSKFEPKQANPIIRSSLALKSTDVENSPLIDNSDTRHYVIDYASYCSIIIYYRPMIV